MRRTGLLLVTALTTGACWNGTTGNAAPESTSTTTPAPTGSSQAPRWLVYASRKGEEVVVSRRRLGPGDPEVLFSYADAGSQEAPDVAASADGRLVGYVTRGLELHVRDLRTERDLLLISGQGREPPPNIDAIPPRWSIDGMNYLTPAEQAECPECGILAIGNLVFSPSGDWLAFGQHYYEGGNWGFLERATGRYETSGDAAGHLMWRDEQEIVTIGAFYGDDAEVRRATLDELPSSRVVATGRAKHRDLYGSLSPTGDRIAVVFDESSDPAVRHRFGVLSIEGGDLSALDTDGEKLSAGFGGDATVVWIERKALSGLLLRPDAEAVPLPDDLYSFADIVPAGPGQVGFSGARRPACAEISGPCEGPLPPFEQRYLLFNIRDGDIVWQSPGFDSRTGFAGLTN